MPPGRAPVQWSGARAPTRCRCLCAQPPRWTVPRPASAAPRRGVDGQLVLLEPVAWLPFAGPPCFRSGRSGQPASASHTGRTASEASRNERWLRPGRDWGWQGRRHAAWCSASAGGRIPRPLEVFGMKLVRPFVVAVLALALLASASLALADRRVALVVGNSTYSHIGRLPNADTAARDMSSAQRRLASEVTTELHAGWVALNEAPRVFTRRADLSPVFYAGHGIEIGRVPTTSTQHFGRFAAGRPPKFSQAIQRPHRNSLNSAGDIRCLALVPMLTGSYLISLTPSMLNSHACSRNTSATIGLSMASEDTSRLSSSPGLKGCSRTRCAPSQ